MTGADDIMTCSSPALDSTPSHSARGIFFGTPQLPPTRPARPRQDPVAAANPLERLAQLVNSNDRLMDELTTSRARIVSARAYLDRPGSNAGFGAAHLERCRDRHAGILAQLRANRIEALRLLGEGGTGD